jgi:hypothetical protein
MESIFPFLFKLKLDVHIASALQMEKAHNLERQLRFQRDNISQGIILKYLQVIRVRSSSICDLSMIAP